MHWPGYVLG